MAAVRSVQQVVGISPGVWVRTMLLRLWNTRDKLMANVWNRGAAARTFPPALRGWQ